MNSPATRRTMVVALALAFVVQTGLVYTDDTADNLPSLSEEAQEGWWLWHHHNCQSCHQFFGYGGFLGPDLTNAADRLTDERLQSCDRSRIGLSRLLPVAPTSGSHAARKPSSTDERGIPRDNSGDTHS